MMRSLRPVRLFLSFCLLTFARSYLTARLPVSAEHALSAREQMRADSSFHACNDFFVIASGRRGSRWSASISLLYSSLRDGPARNGGRVEGVGDGLTVISESLVNRALRRFMQGQTRPFCIVLRAVTTTDAGGNVVIAQANEDPLDVSFLFAIIRDGVGETPISIINTGRHRDAVARDFSLLPLGTVLITFDDHSREYDTSTFRLWLTELRTMAPGPTALDLFYLYLVRCLREWNSPTIAITGEYNYDVVRLMAPGIERDITPATLSSLSRIAGSQESVAPVATALTQRHAVPHAQAGVALAIILDCYLRLQIGRQGSGGRAYTGPLRRDVIPES